MFDRMRISWTEGKTLYAGVWWTEEAVDRLIQMIRRGHANISVELIPIGGEGFIADYLLGDQ